MGGGGWVGGGCQTPLCDIPSGCCSFTGGLDSHPFFPSHVASGRCFLSAAAAGAVAVRPPPPPHREMLSC